MSTPPPPPAAPTAAPTTCPHCNAPVAPDAKFCAQCGATLGTPAPPPAAGAPAVDIRSRVDQDRGALKKLQMLLPGYRGYRIDEDIRAADSLLRRQVADKLLDTIGQIQQVRQALTNANQYGSLNDLALILSDVTVLEGRIRHAEQGYSGISPAIRIKSGDLDKLYQYDYGFVLAADQLRGQLAPLQAAAGGNNAGAIRTEVDRLRGLTGELQNAFQSRMATIEGIAV
ncbi:MAG TPA: zinc ribbon domain-containing protein [Thermoplasmata archaeon]|nr:zinc ribbon domain-containing protein [Thermoplasmata archaeon]